MRKKLSLLLVALMTMSVYAVAGTWKATSETKVAAESTYLDDDLLTVKTVYATTLKADKQEFADQSFTHFVQVRNAAYPIAAIPTGTEQSGSTSLVVTAKKDVVVTLYYRRQPQTTTVSAEGVSSSPYTLNGGKALRIYEQGEGTISEISSKTGLAVVKEVVTEKSGGGYDVFGYSTTKIFLEKGKTYTLSAKGTTIQFYGFEAAEPKAAFEIDDFNFAASNVGVSYGSGSIYANGSLSIDGDLFVESTITDPNSEVVLTVSKSAAATRNRFWQYQEKPQLRLYGTNTLTFQAPEDVKITDLAINYGSWNGSSSFAVGSVVSNEDGVITWKGNNNKVVLNIAGNTNINSIAIKTSAPAVQAYAVYDPDTQTLTFKYDKNMPEENAWLCGETGETNPTWNQYYLDPELGYSKAYADYRFVVFDDSFAKARPTSCHQWFTKWNLTSFVGWSNFNTSEVTDMAYMFSNASQLKSINLAGFDTQKVTTMKRMFQNCQGLTEIDLSAFNTEKVKDMEGMFSNCLALTKLDLSKFNTANVEKMNDMFKRCLALKELDLSSFNTENVTDMNNMFNMELLGETEGAKLEKITLSSFNTAKVTDMSRMFYNCGQLKSLDLSSFNTEKVTNMSEMFYNDSTMTTINLSSFNTEKVVNFNKMFWGCKALTALDLNHFDIRSAYSLEAMFAGCAKLATLKIDNFDTQYVNYMNQMFKDCAALTALNLLKFDTQIADNNGYWGMENMFSGCAKLAKIEATDLFVNSYSDNNMFTGCVALPDFDDALTGGQTAVDTYCSISKVIFNQEVKAGEYLTFYTDNALKLYGNVGKIMTITGVSATEVEVKELKVAAKKTPLLIQNESEEDAKIMLISAAKDDEADNVKPYAGFLGTTTGQNIAGSTEGLNYYVCNGDEFVWVMNGGWINANRCWLVVEDTEAAAAPQLEIVDELTNANTTGISVANAANQKSADIYDLQGRKVSKAQKGMYIINGKKVVMK